MHNEFAKCEIKTSVFSGRKSQVGNCWLDELLEHGGEDCPGLLVGRFQRGGDVASLGKENRQRRELVADSDGLHVGCWDVSAYVGRHDQRLVGRRYERLVAEIVPDRLVNALGVAGRRREKVHDEQIHPLIEDVGRFLDKGPKRCAALLIARREDLDDGDNFPASVSNHNAVGPFRIIDPFDFGDQPRSRRRRGDGDPAFRPCFWLVSLERDDIRNRTTGDLLRHGHVTDWKQPGVQGVADRDHPALVKIVKISCFDSSPVVNRHVASPWVASILPWPDRRGKFSRLAIPITQVLLPALVRSGVERPACFLLKTSEPSLPPKRTECPGHSHSSLLVSSLFSRISSISWFALFVLFFPFASSPDQPVPPNLEPPLRQPSLPPRARADRGRLVEQAVFLLLPGQPSEFGHERVPGWKERFLAVEDGGIGARRVVVASRAPASGARARACPCARSSVTRLWRWPRSKGRKPTCE